MGNPKKKAGKTADKRNMAPQPRVVLYGLSEESERGMLVRETIGTLGFATRTAMPDDLATPVGAFAGMKGFHYSKSPWQGEAPSVEFMLICNLTNKQLDALLAAMRNAECSVGCKAQVTQFNRFWPLSKLIEEVSAEHAALSQGAQEFSQGAQE